MKSLTKQLQEQTDIARHWRRLAIQFDESRMVGKAIIQRLLGEFGLAASEEARRYLASPPPNGVEALNFRIQQAARNNWILDKVLKPNEDQQVWVILQFSDGSQTQAYAIWGGYENGWFFRDENLELRSQAQAWNDGIEVATVLAWMPIPEIPKKFENLSPAYPDGIEPLGEFKSDQWWMAELRSLAEIKGATFDQKRAVAVVRNLMKTVDYINKEQK